MSKCQRIALASLYKLIRSLLKYGEKGKPTLLQKCLLNPLVESILQAKLIYQVSKASKRNLSKGWFFALFTLTRCYHLHYQILVPQWERNYRYPVPSVFLLYWEKQCSLERRKFRHTELYIKTPCIKSLRHEARNRKSLLGRML